MTVFRKFRHISDRQNFGCCNRIVALFLVYFNFDNCGFIVLFSSRKVIDMILGKMNTIFRDDSRSQGMGGGQL